MKNFIQPGDVVTVTAPTGGVTSGQLVVISAIVGVAATTQAAGAGSTTARVKLVPSVASPPTVLAAEDANQAKPHEPEHAGAGKRSTQH
jgi:predicted RecA/RadA family phage recombinase